MDILKLIKGRDCYIRLIVVLLSYFLIACQPTPVRLDTPRRSVAPLPDWINSPPIDTDEFLYGVGEGEQRKAALQEALVDLSSKLGVTVKAQFSTELHVWQREYESFERDSHQRIETEVQATDINQYQVEAQYSASPMQTYILIKTNKAKLLAGYQKHLDKQLRSYSLLKKTWPRLGAFKRYQRVAQEWEKLAEFYRQRLTAQVLSPVINQQKYLAYEKRVMHDYQSARQALSFQVKARNSKAHLFAESVEDALAQNDLLSNRKGYLQVQVSVSEDLSQAYGFYIGRYQIYVKVFEAGRQIGGRQLAVKGQATQGYSRAQHQAVKRFTQTLMVDGRWEEMLGLE